MTEVAILITNETGLHSRPADLFVRTAKLYLSRIQIRNDDKFADAKNIIKVILLNVSEGDEITISADGPDEKDAIESLTALVKSDFTAPDKRIEI